VASALFTVRVARFSKLACLFLAKVLAKIQLPFFCRYFGQHKISSLRQSVSSSVLIRVRSGF
jgi:hypothetical protein